MTKIKQKRIHRKISGFTSCSNLIKEQTEKVLKQLLKHWRS